MESHEEINATLEILQQNKVTELELKRAKLEACLQLGKLQSKIKTEYPSTKLRGKAVSELVPNSQRLDATTRCHCTWLFEALNDPDHPASDILEILRIDSIFDLGSESPTHIKREYERLLAGPASHG